MAVTESPSRAPGMAAPEEKRIDEELSRLILLSEQVRSAVDEAVAFKSECCELGKQADLLSDVLRSLARFTASAPSLYERPIRRVATEASRNLEQALALARKCKPHNILRRVVTMTSAANFRKITSLLDNSIKDLKWLLGVFDTEGEGGDIEILLPPIASNEPILALVWPCIASLHMGPLPDRIEAANSLASVARENDRLKMIIMEEGGLPPLLKLLKESLALDAREATTTALRYLANDQGRVQAIVNELGVETILQILPSLSGVWTTIEDRQSQPQPDQIVKANDDLSKRTRNLPDGGVLEVSDRVYVFDYCLTCDWSFSGQITTDWLKDDGYKFYMRDIVAKLQHQFSAASFMVLNFGERDNQSPMAEVLSEYDITVMELPQNYGGCPIPRVEIIHNFLRSADEWLSSDTQQNVLLMYCERGAWPVLAFMLASLLLYRKKQDGEQKTLDMIYKKAAHELLQLTSTLNPLPSQLRYLHYVSTQNAGLDWPPQDKVLVIKNVVLRSIPHLDAEGGCCPIVKILGQDPLWLLIELPKFCSQHPEGVNMLGITNRQMVKQINWTSIVMFKAMLCSSV